MFGMALYTPHDYVKYFLREGKLALTFPCIMLKMTKYTLKTSRCKHGKFFEVRLAIFQH